MKTDWKQVLIDLRRHGVNQRQIADHLQSNGIAYTKSSVEKLSQGICAEPSHSAGQAILELHQQKTRDEAGKSGAITKSTPKDTHQEFTMKHDVSNKISETVAFNFANVQAPVNKVDGLHPSCTTLVDDQIESAHSREKAELQKALAARLDELQAEREKNKTQAESIGQCLDEIDRLKRLTIAPTKLSAT